MAQFTIRRKGVGPPADPPPVEPPPPPPQASGSNYEERVDSLLSAGTLVAAWDFDDASDLMDTRTPSHTIQQLTNKYTWDISNDAILSVAGIGPRGSLSFSRLSSEAIALATVANGAGYWPVVDTGAVKLTIPSQGGAGNGGYIWIPFRGLGTNYSIGPDHANGGECWIQVRLKFTGGWFDPDLKTALAGGGIKQAVWFFGEPPGGNHSSDFEFTPFLRITNNADGSFLHSMSGQQGGDPYEETISGTLYLQNAALCPYSGVGLYTDPCLLMDTLDFWYEFTYAMTLRPVAADFTVAGTTLSRGTGTFTSGMVGRKVYIVGDGFYTISTFVDTQNVTLNASPIAGASKSVYISDYPNTRVRAWRDGIPYLDYGTASAAWGVAGDGFGGNGFGSCIIQAHATGKNPAIAHDEAYVFIDDLIIATAEIPRKSALARMADSLSAGQWGDLAATGVDTAFHDSGASGVVNPYAVAFPWDATLRRAHFLGSDHGPAADYKHIYYDAATNSCVDLGRPSWLDPNWPNPYNDAHGYSLTAIDSPRRRLYRLEYGGNKIHVYNLDTSAWISTITGPFGSYVLDSLTFFTALDSLIVTLSDGGSVLRYNLATLAWTTLGVVADLNDSWVWGVDNPVENCAIFGVGNTLNPDLWKLNSSGTLSQLNDMTKVTYDGGGTNGLVTLEPSTGKYLIMTVGVGSRDLSHFNVNTQSVTATSIQPPSFVQEADVFLCACPIPEYSGTLWVATQSASGSKIYFRKDG